MERIKVVWLCVTPISPINHILKLKKVPKILAPWITVLINELKKRDEIELHIISSGPSWKKSYRFVYEGVHYNFIRRFTPSFMKPFREEIRLDIFLNSLHLKRVVKRLVEKINPDIINLHGTEHEICTAFPQLNGNKILTIQGFINLVYQETPSPVNFWLLKTENKLLATTEEFIVQANFMLGIIKKYNPAAKFTFCQYPSFRPHILANDFVPDTDIIYASRICKDKGIEDLLNALVNVKKVLPKIKMKIIGKVSKEYEFYIKNLISTLGISGNINFIGFVQSYDELYQHIAKSKIFVLPTHHDVIPSSVIESMFIGTPVISNCVGGLPDLNLEKQTCILVKKGDVNSLAKCIEDLLDDNQMQKQLIVNAKEMVSYNFDEVRIGDRLIEIYRNKIAQKLIDKRE